MANDLHRRLKMLEANARNSAPVLAVSEIDQAVARYEGARDVHHTHTPTPDAFRTMLRAMRPSLARIFLAAHPQDLML
ncbi:hypothetical protein [Sphingobium yanoikuyae]|uniref:hypothetical protein n=1 Tax=Sphingobium yanoikuyae TaxID=13690 RepID=UPI0028A921D6|nr:hypothetical protein [Sphingobium yanoikuyae]